MTLLLVKNHVVETLIGALASNSSNSSFVTTGLWLSEEGSKKMLVSAARANIEAKKRKEGKYPKFLFINSPIIGPARSPRPPAVSA